MFDMIDLVETHRKLAGADAAVMGDGELCGELVALEQVRSLTEAALAHRLAELDARGTTDTEFGMRTAAWLAREAGVSPAVTKKRLKIAKMLRRLSRVDAAVSAGDLSWDHARAVADAANPRVLDALADVQDDLIDHAHNVTFGRWQGEVRRLVDLVDQDGPAPGTDPDTNRAYLSVGLDGVTRLDATFDATLGAVVASGLAAMVDELHRRYSTDHHTDPTLTVPGPARLRAEATAELVRRGNHTTTGIPRAEVTLIVRDGHVTNPDGHPVPDTAAGVWACDPDLYALVVDGLGVPLDAGRQQRLATPAQRRAVRERDGGCVFPGCDQRIAWCDVHHVDWWEHAGPTDLPNLAALCRHHHTVTHRPGWSMHTTPDHWYWWTNPSGHTFWGQRHHQRRTGPTPDTG